MIIYSVPLLVCLVGLLMYALSQNNPTVKELGRIMFAFGLLATLMSAPQVAAVLRTTGH